MFKFELKVTVDRGSGSLQKEITLRDTPFSQKELVEKLGAAIASAQSATCDGTGVDPTLLLAGYLEGLPLELRKRIDFKKLQESVNAYTWAFPEI